MEKFAATSKFRYFKKNKTIVKIAPILHQIWKDRYKLAQKQYFYADEDSDDVTVILWIMPLYSC